MIQNGKKYQCVTIVLTILNIAVYILYTILGDMLYNMGSLSVLDIIGRKEYYRIITCMFMHGGVEHLFGNMLFLFILGQMLEEAIGHIPFTVVYFVSGIGSGIFSMMNELRIGSYYHSVGASGAVCGLIGAMLFLVMIHKGYYKQISLQRMLLAIVYLIYTGLQSARVNNAAHIGGLIIGFAVMIVLYYGSRLIGRDLDRY